MARIRVPTEITINAYNIQELSLRKSETTNFKRK